MTDNVIEFDGTANTEPIEFDGSSDNEPVEFEVTTAVIDAVSPRVTTEPIEGGTRVTVTDIDGDHPFDVMDGLPGHDGQDGQDGHTPVKGIDYVDGVSPTVATEQISGGTRVTITDGSGDHTFDMMDGHDGTDGHTPVKGVDYTDGVSPAVTTESITGGTQVTITDAAGSHTFDVMDGTDGHTPEKGVDYTDGVDGISPSVTTSSITGGTRVTISDADGDHTFDVMDGKNGTDGHTPVKGVDYFDGMPGQDGHTPVKGVDYFDGVDGFSPTASVSKSGTTVTITVTDKTGTTSAQVSDGTPGAKGDPGDDYILTAEDKAEIAGMVTVPVQDVQIGGTSIVSGGTANIEPAALDMPVTVSGTDPVISASAGVRYICGTVSTISITPPASGTCEVRFTSGTSVAVLTIPSAVIMPEWFDSTALETGRIYDIIITDGVYGSVMSWPA